MKRTYPLYLAGRPVQTKARLAVTDKYSGDTVCQVSMADAKLVDRAIAAAVAAKPAMAALPSYQRAEILLQCVSAFERRHEELAQALCIEAGKPIKDARVEVDRLIDTFRIAAGEATRINGEQMDMQVSPRAMGLTAFTRRVPLGVLSFITPFNFPLNLVAHKVAPAIAAGCPFVLKPSDKTPVGALIIAEVLAATDLPKGAFSVLPCPVDEAQALVEDERIEMLSFTGGQIGWSLKAKAGRKAVTLELGGNAACIVDADPGIDTDSLVERLAFGGYYQSGQSCISVQRLLVHESMYPEVRRRLRAKVKSFKMGNPKFTTVTIGPMIDEQAAERVESWIRAARKAGAGLLAGGDRNGRMLPAHLLENVPHDQLAWREEVFGPLVCIESFSDFTQALQTVNASDYGLQAGVFTARRDHAMQAWNALDVGGVVIGDVPSIRVDHMPYGGVKGSGCGLEGVPYAIREMTRPRLLLMRD